MEKSNAGKWFYLLALVMLLAALVFGVLAALSYSSQGLWKESLGFIKLRPLHVSSALFWILTGANGIVFFALQAMGLKLFSPVLARVQWLLWVVAMAGIFYSYFSGDFGGREYWEYPPVWSVFIFMAWVLLAINFFMSTGSFHQRPVYFWMWSTGIIFFLLIFLENYLWIFPSFREHFLQDTTIQWKVNGSLVGCWNQMIYGTAMFLMEKISGDKTTARSPLAFSMYFLGLFNLMFNWSHHIYTLPTAEYVRYIGYIVSMTEWIILLRIIYTWKAAVSTAKKHLHYYPYRFLLAADAWVFLNLFLALLMSVPAINLYTHGTHFTVAHAMGTTIGINSMLLLAAGFEFSGLKVPGQNKTIRAAFIMVQVSLLLFWIVLIAAGVYKANWQMNHPEISHTQMMQSLRPVFVVFTLAGLVLMFSLGSIAFYLFKKMTGPGQHLSTFPA
ncbi:MAG: cbb3-type cytochrome c oxidase subunit I [Bacteroidia bacterium]|nr:cbb3-type cytochrome c oxidase subunit I [Bacteroidia bacterium]